MCAVTNMVASCSSSMSCFPGMLLGYFLNYSKMVPAVPIITGITFVDTFHGRSIIFHVVIVATTLGFQSNAELHLVPQEHSTESQLHTIHQWNRKQTGQCALDQ